MKNLLFPFIAILVSSNSLLAQNGKSVPDFPNTSPIQYSNIGEYSNDGNQKSHFAIGYNTRVENKLIPQLMMNPAVDIDGDINRLVSEVRPLEPNDLGNDARVESPSSASSVHTTTTDVASSSHDRTPTSVVNFAGETEFSNNREVTLPDNITGIGLENGGNDCFINSSLQLLKALRLKSQSAMPNLAKFLSNEVMTSQNCKALRQELANQVMHGQNEFQNVVSNINKTGSANEQHDAHEFISVLLEKFDASQVHFQNIITRIGNQIDQPGEITEGILSLDLPESEGIEMQDIIDNYVKDEVPKEESLIIKEEKKLIEPFSQSLVVLIKRFGTNNTKRQNIIQNVLKSITLSAANGESVTYEPKAIICHVNSMTTDSGHYICYRKEGNAWWQFNDNIVINATVIPGSKDYNNIHKNCYVIAYNQKSTVDNTIEGIYNIADVNIVHEIEDAANNEEAIDSVFEKKMKQIIPKVMENFLLSQNYDNEVDALFKKYDGAWKEKIIIDRKFKEIQKKLEISKQELKKAEKATDEKELEERKLAKVNKYAQIVGSTLTSVPDPTAITPIVGAGVKISGGVLSVINVVWAYKNLLSAQREKNENEKEYNKILEQKNQLDQQLSLLEQDAQQKETTACINREQEIKKIAEELHPETDWQERQWVDWANFINSKIDSKLDGQEKNDLIGQTRSNLDLIKKITKRYWEQKVKNSKQQYLISKNMFAISGHNYQSAFQRNKQAGELQKQQQDYFDQNQNSIETLKNEINDITNQLDQLETHSDQVQFEEKKGEFIKKFQSLQKKFQSIKQIKNKLEDAKQKTLNQEKKLLDPSVNYLTMEKKINRAKKTYYTDLELLQRIWLKSAYSDYKNWSLPENIEFRPTENVLNSLEVTKVNKVFIYPLQRFKELEALGRLETGEISSMTAEQNSTNISIRNPLAKYKPFRSPKATNFSQVQEWSQKKQENPSNQDRVRWDVKEKLDQLEKEIRIIRKKLKKDSLALAEKQSCSSNRINDDDDDQKSQPSTDTEQTLISQDFSVSSMNVSKSNSLFNFGGTLLNSGDKKQLSLSLVPISEEIQNPEEKLRQREEQLGEFKDKYFKCIEQAEEKRLNKQKEAIPFNSKCEFDRNYAWVEADRRSVELIQEKRREEEREKIAQEEQKDWQTNTERWRLRAQADQSNKNFLRAKKLVKKLGKQLSKATIQAQVTEIAEKRKEALVEEENLKKTCLVAEEEWEKMAQEYNSEHAAQNVPQEQGEKQDYECFSLKERDRAVNRRWKKLLKDYQNPGLKKSDVTQEEIDEAIMVLEDKLDQAYKNDENSYREVAFKKALEDARDNPKKMTEAWKQLGAQEKMSPAQKINKEAAEAFNKEAKRLERIEKIWEGILQDEQEEAKKTREQAAKKYYEGNHSDWYALSDQEQMNYNNEVKRDNEEFIQERKNKQELLEFYENQIKEKEQTETAINQKIAKCGFAFNLMGNKKEFSKQLNDIKTQKEEIENKKVELQKDIDKQEKALAFGTKKIGEYQEKEAQEALINAKNILPEKVNDIENAWDIVIEEAEIAEKIWDAIIQTCNNSLKDPNQILQMLEWQKVIAHAQKKQNEWREKVDGYGADKGKAIKKFKEEEAREKAKTSIGIISDVWKEVADSWEKSFEYWKKVTENSDYSLAAEQSELAAEQSTKAAEAYAKAKGEDRQWREGSGWKEAGKTTQLSVDYRIKSIEKRNNQEKEEAKKYEEAGKKFQQASENFTQSVQLLLEGKEKESCILWNEGHFLQSEGMSKKYNIQANEAGKSEKENLLIGYKAAATISQTAANQYKQSALLLSDLGKESESVSLSREGSSLQAMADYQAEANEAAESKNEDLVEEYSKAAVTSQRAAKQYKQSSLAYAKGKISEGIYWNNAGNSSYYAAEKLVKAIDADIGVAQKWREAAEKQKESVKYFMEAVKVRRNGEKYEAINWNNAGRALYNAAEKLVKVIGAEVAKQSDVAQKWNDAAEEQMKSVELFIKAAEAHKKKNLSEGACWNSAANGFYNAAEKLVKAIDANVEIAEKYRAAAKKQEDSVEHYKKAAEAYAEGKTSEGIDCNNKGNKFYYDGISLSHAAEQAAKVIQEE